MPTGAVTLLDSVKNMDESPSKGIVGTYATAYEPLTVLPMPDTQGGVWNWDLENQLPYTSTQGSRNFNASFNSTKGDISPMSENVKIYGGRVQIDRAIEKISPNKVTAERVLQVKAKARRFTVDMFEGQGGTNLRGIDHWIDNDPHFSNQKYAVGTASAGVALLTDHLDRLLSLVNKGVSTRIYCSDNIGLRIRKLSRGGNNVTSDNNYATRFTPEQFGYFAGMYSDVPVVVLKDGKGTDLLQTDRGDGSSSYVYAVSYGTQMFTGFQRDGVSIYNLGDNTSYNYFDIEHLVGVAPQSIRSVARLDYVAETV